MSQHIFAHYFDGKSSNVLPIRIEFLEESAELVASEVNARVPFLVLPTNVIRYEPPIGKRGYTLLYLPQGEAIQVPPNIKLPSHGWKGATSYKKNWMLAAIQILERKWSHLSGLIAIALIVVLGIYLYLLPVGVRYVAPRVPVNIKESLGDGVLALLEKEFLKPSKIGEAQQQELYAIFYNLLVEADLKVTPQLKIGAFYYNERDLKVANAFAVLPKTVIITDSLVEKLTTEEVAAVLAHELGHLFFDHGTQVLLRSSLVSLSSIALFGGDISEFHTLGLALLESSYSREQETESDLFAVALLKRSGINPNALVTALEKLTGGRDGHGFFRYLESHPSTKDRARVIRNPDPKSSSL